MLSHIALLLVMKDSASSCRMSLCLTAILNLPCSSLNSMIRRSAGPNPTILTWLESVTYFNVDTVVHRSQTCSGIVKVPISAIPSYRRKIDP
jgi:hypothetical protein